MNARSELRIARAATPSEVRSLRHAMGAFLAVFSSDRAFVSDVLLAVGEVLANAVEHARGSGEEVDIEIVAYVRPDAELAVHVRDSGRFIARDRQPGRGFGLRIVRSIASNVTIETDNGTHVAMTFAMPALRAAGGDARS